MKSLFSYASKLTLKFRPWNFIFFTTSPLLIAYFFFSINNRHRISLNSEKKEKILKKMKEKSKILINRLKNDDLKVLMADEEKCKIKIEKMMEDGHLLLQVISDFDRTMSRYMINDTYLNPTCHGIIEHYPNTNTDMKKEHALLRDYYYPIEVDTSLTNDEKIPYMIEWWTKAHEAMVKGGLSLSVFNDTVKQCNLTLRIDCDKFMKTLNSHNVPLLIFSAGIGNVIDTLLKHRGLLFDNVRIVSNFMNFNEEGILSGFQDAIIHTFNKYAKSIQDSEFYDSICTKRRNVLLLGDSTGDPHMSDGLAVDANVLKIGFLNSNVESLKSKYMSLYDIVIVSDESFTVPNLILEAVLSEDNNQ